jgi:ABC-2 type transport system permease protein
MNFMSRSFWELFKTNLRVIYRDTGGIFWTLAMPLFIYIAVSVLPIGKFINIRNYSNFVLPGVIAMVIMQSGIYSLAYWVVDLKGKGILKRFMATPISKLELIGSMVAARVVVMYVQAVLLTLVGLVFFHASFAGNILSSLLIILLGSSIFLLGGLLISTVADTYQAAAPITAGVALPMVFLSSIFYSLDQLPHSLATVARILPMTYFADGLRAVYLYKFDFSLIAKDVLIMAAWLIVILFISIWRFKLED